MRNASGHPIRLSGCFIDDAWDFSGPAKTESEGGIPTGRWGCTVLDMTMPSVAPYWGCLIFEQPSRTYSIPRDLMAISDQACDRIN